MGLKIVNVLSSLTIAGVPYESILALNGNDEFSNSYSVPAAKVGALTTRTSTTVGTLTMAAGHGFTDAVKIDLYWDGGCRRGVLVGTVAADEVPITAGTGDDLPADETAITAMIPQSGSFPVTVADVKAIAVKTDVESQFTFLEADGTTENKTFHLDPDAAGTPVSAFYAVGLGTAPTGTTIATVKMSHADPLAAHVMTPAYMSN